MLTGVAPLAATASIRRLASLLPSIIDCLEPLLLAYTLTMAYEDESEPRYYRVTLKSGETATFTDTNNRPNYPGLLATGIYSIFPTDGSDFIPISADNILSIEEVDSPDDTVRPV